MLLYINIVILFGHVLLLLSVLLFDHSIICSVKHFFQHFFRQGLTLLAIDFVKNVQI